MEKSQYLAYCRTSTDNQKDEKTIDIQRENLAKYANQNKIQITAWFLDDGISGALEHRPELIRMMEHLKNNSDIEGVLIYKLDRLARDLYLQEGLVREFFKLNKKVVSVLEPNLDSDDPFRKAFRQMLGVFAEFEKAMITLRMKSGKAKKSQNDGGFGGSHIFGYRSKGGQLTIYKSEAEIVQKIYYLKRKKKMNLTTIASYLNSNGVKTRLRGKWFASSVKNILQNPLYKGKVRFHGQIYNGQHERLI